MKKQGGVDQNDIEKMIKRLGIKINSAEAQVLLASAKGSDDPSPVLDPNEFNTLIFSTNQALDVDLSSMKPTSN